MVDRLAVDGEPRRTVRHNTYLTRITQNRNKKSKQAMPVQRIRLILWALVSIRIYHVLNKICTPNKKNLIEGGGLEYIFDLKKKTRCTPLCVTI